MMREQVRQSFINLSHTRHDLACLCTCFAKMVVAARHFSSCTVITVHHRIFYGFCKFGTVFRSITVRTTVRSRISLDYGKSR